MYVIRSFLIAAAILVLPGSAAAQCQLDLAGCAPNAKPPSFYQPVPSPTWEIQRQQDLLDQRWADQRAKDIARREALGAVLQERHRQGRTFDDGLTAEQRRWGWRKIP